MNNTSDSIQVQKPDESKAKYELILNWYKVNGKNLLGEEILPELDIKTLMVTLGNPIWNQIYHCWAIEIKHMPKLQNYIQHTFDPEKFVYFIEAYKNQDSHLN